MGDHNHDKTDVYTSKIQGKDVSKHAPLAGTLPRMKVREPKKNLRDRNKLSFGIDEGEDSSEDVATTLSSIVKNRKEKTRVKIDSKKPRNSGFGFGGYQTPSIDLDHETQQRQKESYHSGLSMNDFDDELTNRNLQGLGYVDLSTTVESGDVPMYGKESLSKLISQQNMYSVDHGSTQQTKADAPKDYNFKIHENGSGNQNSPQTDAILRNDDFIPLNSKTSSFMSEPIILTGDDALDHNMAFGDSPTSEEELLSPANPIDKNHREPSKSQNPPLDDNDIDEGGNQWEETITRRAGLAQNKSISNNMTWNKSDEPVDVNEREKVISKIRNTIASTIASFQGKITDLEQCISRKTQEYDVSRNDMEKLITEQTAINTKFDYYQKLRSELVTWVGALRDVTPKLAQIEDALRQMSEERAIERNVFRREWEEDVYTILITDTGSLDHVMGKIPVNTNSLSSGTTDEFGRDVGSLHRLARNKRTARRHKWRTENRKRLHHSDDTSLQLSSALRETQLECEQSDFGMDDDDLMNMEERRKALSDAVDVVLSELDDHYTSISKLLQIMVEWIHSYPDDFDLCFATLSFSEMIHILAQSEICSKVDLLSHLMDSEPYKYIDQRLEQCQWFRDLLQLNDTIENDATISIAKATCLKSVQSCAIDLIIRKTCIPYFLSTLSPIQDVDTIIPGPYEWCSYRQSRKMSSFYSSLAISLSDENRTLYIKPVWEMLLCHLRSYMENRPTFLLTSQAVNSIQSQQDHNTENEKEEAIMFAAFGQIYFWKKVLKNCTSCWAPKIAREESIEMAHVILEELVSKRLLSLLTVLDKGFSTKSKSHEMVQDEIRCIVSDVYEAISSVKWLEFEELMIASAPLRAIRHKYAYVG